MQNFFSEQWKKYKARKTKVGIIADFSFLLLIILILNPSTGRPIKSYFTRLTMSSPKEEANLGALSNQDYQWQYIDLDNKVKNFADLKGKVIFLNFWATWCPPCLAEFPSINELYKEYGEQVEFVLISDEDDTKISKFLTDNNYEISSYRAVNGKPDVLSKGVFPSTFVISKEGKIVVQKTGAANWHSESVKNILNKLISE